MCYDGLRNATAQKVFFFNAKYLSPLAYLDLMRRPSESHPSSSASGCKVPLPPLLIFFLQGFVLVLGVQHVGYCVLLLISYAEP